MKIVWLDINASYSHSSLALPALHAQIKDRPISREIEWSVVRGSIKTDQSELLSSVIAERPDIILSSMWLFNHEYLVKLIAKIKSLVPTATVIVGGPEFLGDNRKFLEHNSYVDGVFRGEGELFLEQWLPIYGQRELWQEITGICYLDGGVYHDGGRAVVQDFSSLRYPEESPFFVLDRNFIQLETTRGCFNGCWFCVSGRDKPVRSLSLEQVKERLDYYAKEGVGSIRMLDRTFNGNSSRCVELLDLIKSYSGRLTFHLEVHPALLDDRLKETLSKMPEGLLHIEAGIQSLRQNVLDGSGRSGKLDRALEGLEFLFSLSDKMETHADLIAGLPHYSYSELLEDTRKLVEMRSGEIQLELLKLLPGTRMHESARELGIVYSPKPPYEVLSTRDISFDELTRSMVLSRLLDIYYNHSSWSELFRAVAMDSDNALDTITTYFWSSREKLFSISQETRAKLLGDFIVEKMPHLCSIFCKTWIASGLNIRKMPLFTDMEPLQSYLDSNYNKAESAHMRCYMVSASEYRWIIVYDRHKDHSRPISVIPN